MCKSFANKKNLSVALALATFGALSLGQAFAQSASTTGSPLAWHYDASGARLPGWSPQDPSVQQLAHAPSADNNGLGAYAQAPATVHHRRINPVVGSH